MLCDVCKCNDATVFLTQILEGKMHKVNLCEACSKEKGVQDPTGFALADLLLGIGAAEEIAAAPAASAPARRSSCTSKSMSKGASLASVDLDQEVAGDQRAPQFRVRRLHLRASGLLGGRADRRAREFAAA